MGVVHEAAAGLRRPGQNNNQIDLDPAEVLAVLDVVNSTMTAVCSAFGCLSSSVDSVNVTALETIDDVLTAVGEQLVLCGVDTSAVEAGLDAVGLDLDKLLNLVNRWLTGGSSSSSRGVH